MSLLEVAPLSGSGLSSMPLLVYPLRTCFENQARMAAMSELDGASAVQLAEIAQAVCDNSSAHVFYFKLWHSALTYLLTPWEQPGRPFLGYCRPFVPLTRCYLGDSHCKSRLMQHI